MMKVESATDDIFYRRVAGLIPQAEACEDCRELSGSHEQPPIHPNCRCDFEDDD